MGKERETGEPREEIGLRGDGEDVYQEEWLVGLLHSPEQVLRSKREKRGRGRWRQEKAKQQAKTQILAIYKSLQWQGSHGRVPPPSDDRHLAPSGLFDPSLMDCKEVGAMGQDNPTVCLLATMHGMHHLELYVPTTTAPQLRLTLHSLQTYDGMPYFRHRTLSVWHHP